jgi:RNA polymerase sigma-70 factor, ECF subfamily
LIAAQAGVDGTALDQPAFMALVEPVLPAAFRLAVAMLHSDVDAEDAVQEAVFKAWRHRGRFRSGSPMQPWLLAIVANECRAVRRNRWWSIVKVPGGALGGEDPTDASPESAALRRAIRALPHDQRLVVALRYYVDLSFEDVARVLNISTKAAKSRTYRALERLRLDPEVAGDEDV